VHRPLLFLAMALAAVSVSTTANASDRTLRTTLNSWSAKISLDAGSVSLAAKRRHPRRMTSSATRFRSDAVHARAALVAQTPSTAKGARARRLALAAFAAYAHAGGEWASSGRARLSHHRTRSIAAANAGARYARTGNSLLVEAGKLLR
jgi:hypothetical protein